ncbi:MAG: hypothetical protein SAMD01599839_13430 [Rectinema sp.]
MLAPQLPKREKARRDGSVANHVAHLLPYEYRARATIAFAAAFFCRCQPKLPPDDIEGGHALSRM